MVIAHTPRAGQFAKKKSVKLWLRAMGTLFIVGMLVIGALCFCLGLYFNARQTLDGFTGMMAIILFCVVTAFALGLVFTMDRILEKISRRRIQLLRGGEAEAYTSLLLRDKLESDDWELWDNFLLDTTPRPSDIDHILIGPGGFFVISTKSQKGRLILNALQGPTMNGRPVAWCNDVTRQALRLRDKITVIERDTPPPWIQTILCLPFAHIEPRDPKTHRVTCGTVWVVNEDDLIDAIEDWPAHHDRKTRLSKPAREKWASAVGRLAANAPS